MSSNKKRNFILICSGAVLSIKSKRQKRKWVKEWLVERYLHSDLGLVKKLCATEPEDYRHYLRMTEDQFLYLLKLVDPLIRKKNTLMRPSISSEERLIVTLRYLATGIDYSDLKYSSRIPFFKNRR